MAVALPGAEKAAERALDLLDKDSRLVSIVGRDGSGKSSALQLIEAGLGARGVRVFRAAFPRHGDDAAIVAMLDVGAQLESAPLLDALRDPNRRWADKQSRLVSELRKVADAGRAVILLDDPVERDAERVSDLFNERSATLTQGLRNVSRVQVVQTTRRRTGLEDVSLEAGSIPAEVLAPLKWTGSRREAAERLGHIPRLGRYSPLELRLLVVLVGNGLDAGELGSARLEPRRIVERVFAERISTAARELLGTLALVRTPFDRSLLDRLHVAELESHERALIEEALLIHEAPDSLRLHDLVAREAVERGWLSDTSRALHELSSWHDARFAAAVLQHDTRTALRHEIEVIHQLTEAGDAAALLTRSIGFVEQLDALGKSLSLKGRFAEAVSVYERALAHDDNDAYAHHYLAFNLDVEARDKARSLNHYARAKQEEPTHVWYHGRRICFLITIGRLDEAMEAWSEACAQFDDDPLIQTELHRPVAQLLLHRGQLDSARRVLDEVPPQDRTTSDWYASLELLLTEQEEAEEHRFVFPFSVPRETRWSGPHLLRDARDIERVVTWVPGRISSQSDSGLRVRIATREGSEVRFGYRELGLGELRSMTRYPNDLSLPVGTFVELITLTGPSGKTTEVLLTWPRENRWLPGVRPIRPNPDRYIRRAASAV